MTIYKEQFAQKIAERHKLTVRGGCAECRTDYPCRQGVDARLELRRLRILRGEMLYVNPGLATAQEA